MARVERGKQACDNEADMRLSGQATRTGVRLTGKKKEGYLGVAFRVRLRVKWSTLLGNHLSSGTPDGI